MKSQTFRYLMVSKISSMHLMIAKKRECSNTNWKNETNRFHETFGVNIEVEISICFSFLLNTYINRRRNLALFDPLTAFFPLVIKCNSFYLGKHNGRDQQALFNFQAFLRGS